MENLEVILEGPYGRLRRDIFLSDSQARSPATVLLVGEGMGFAPMQAVADQLLLEKTRGWRRLNHVLFVWMDRDPKLLSGATLGLEKKNAQQKEVQEHPPVDPIEEKTLHGVVEEGVVFSNLLSLLAPGSPTDEELEDLYRDMTVDNGIVNQKYNEGKSTERYGGVVEMKLFLTDTNGDGTSSPSCVIKEKPDWHQIFDSLQQKASLDLRNIDGGIEVFICAPSVVVDSCRRHYRKRGVVKGLEVVLAK